MTEVKQTLAPELQRAVDIFLKLTTAAYDVRAAYLFGSRARGDQHAESDADVAVVLNGQPGSLIDTKLAMADLAYDAMLETGVRIQPLPLWPHNWDDPGSFSNPALVRAIQREGVALTG